MDNSDSEIDIKSAELSSSVESLVERASELVTMYNDRFGTEILLGDYLVRLVSGAAEDFEGSSSESALLN